VVEGILILVAAAGSRTQGFSAFCTRARLNRGDRVLVIDWASVVNFVVRGF